jgi:hypothetical protein
MLKSVTATGGQPRLAYSFAEVGQLLGISYHSVLRLNKRKLLRASVGLRKKLVSYDEIQRYLASTQEAN